MINLVFVWMVLFAIVAGWGLFVIFALQRGGKLGGSLGLFQTVWLGYAGLVGFLQVCSFWFPMGSVAIALSVVPALFGYAAQRRVIMRRAREVRLRPRRFAVLACGVMFGAVVVAYAACDLVQLYDTGLYHLQAVKWSTHYSAVPGLANLHYRFGYNNSVHLFAAYTDAFWEGVAAHITNGFLLVIVLGQWLSEIVTARTPRGRLRQAFCLFTLPFLLSRLWTMEVASLSTDLALTVFAFVLVLELLSLEPESRSRSMSLALILALGAIATTTKLGGLALFGVAALLALALLRTRIAWRTRLTPFVLPAVLVIGWVIRGVIASGWLLYPVFGRLPLSWAVPHEVADSDLGNIKSWSRMFGKGPDEVFGHGLWHWFGPWLDGFRMSHEFVLLIIGCALLAWRVAHGATGTARKAGEWAAVAACLLGLVQWFTGAPDLRYGAFLFWLFPAVLFAPMAARASRDAALRPLVLALALALITWAGGFAFHLDARVPKLWGRPPAPRTVEVSRKLAGPHTEVLQPVTADQCFDTDLPCTPSLNATLRDPSSLGYGFVPTISR